MGIIDVLVVGRRRKCFGRKRCRSKSSHTKRLLNVVTKFNAHAIAAACVSGGGGHRALRQRQRPCMASSYDPRTVSFVTFVFVKTIDSCFENFNLFVGFVYRTKTMHQLLCFKSKFPNHFAFTLGRDLFLLFWV